MGRGSLLPLVAYLRVGVCCKDGFAVQAAVYAGKHYCLQDVGCRNELANIALAGLNIPVHPFFASFALTTCLTLVMRIQ